MSVISGVNNYVLEGGEFQHLYDKILKAMGLCAKFDKDYQLGEFGGKQYVIRKQRAEDKDNNLPNYVLMVFEGEDCIAGSCFDDNCIRRKRGCVYFTEEWCDVNGAFEIYVADSEMYKLDGFYFESYNTEDMAGVTNDAECKHFKPSVVYYGVKLPELEQQRTEGKITEKEYLRKYKEQERVIMKGYDALSPEEQLDFCNANKDKIYFTVTEYYDAEQWFAHSAE